MAASNSNTALLTEHLRYAPVSLIDDIINSINDLTFTAVDQVEQGLLATDPATLGFTSEATEETTIVEKARTEVENGAHQLETLFAQTIDKNFDTMEVFAMRSILSVPEDLRDWVRLRHYEGVNYTIPPDAPTVESVMLQRQKLQEVQRLNRLLSAEVSRTAALISRLKAVRALPDSNPIPKTEPTDETSASAPYPTFGFLESRGDLADGSGNTPLSTTTGFAISQLPALRRLLAELRPQMKALPQKRKIDPNVVEDEAEKSWRRERLEYIESQTRRRLENIAGLELGKNGEVRDGEWQGEGRKLGKGEVEDLEKMVDMIGGGRPNRDGNQMDDT